MTEIAKRANGQPLKDDQQKALEFTFAQHLIVKGELEDARNEIGLLRQQITEQAVAMEGLHSLNNLLESRIEGCMAERDQAVKEHAQLESFFRMVFAAMHEFKVPLVKLSEASDAHRAT
jgi:hypothetical protein